MTKKRRLVCSVGDGPGNANAMHESFEAAQRVADAEGVLRMNPATAAWFIIEVARGDLYEARWMAFYRATVSPFWAHVTKHLDTLLAEESTIAVLAEG